MLVGVVSSLISEKTFIFPLRNHRSWTASLGLTIKVHNIVVPRVTIVEPILLVVELILLVVEPILLVVELILLVVELILLVSKK